MHALAVHGELFLEIVRRSEPQTPRADLELDRGIGHAMCLNLVNKLKAVLDRAQKDVRMRQLVPHRLADQAGPGERIERGQRAGLPKRRVAAAVGQLKQLREELDFPDAAAAGLHVAIVRARAERAIAPRLVTRQLFESGAIEISPVHKRLDAIDEAAAELAIAGNGRRLDQRKPLEGLTPRAVVLVIFIERIDDGAARAPGTKPQVDAIQIALRRVLAERGRQLLAEPLKKFPSRALPGVIFRRGVEHVHEIDVRTVIQLPAAELAHADHGKHARHLFARFIRHHRRDDDLQRAIDDDVRQVGNLGGGRLHGLAPEQIASGDAQRLAPLPSLQRVEGFGGIGNVGQHRQNFVLEIAPVGRAALDLRDKPVKIFRIADQNFAEEGRCAQHVREHVHGARIVAEIVQEHRAAGSGRKIPRQPDDCCIRVGRFGQRRQQIARNVPQCFADAHIVCHRLQVLVGARGIAEPQRR